VKCGIKVKLLFYNRVIEKNLVEFMKYLLIGLGNTGSMYDLTRHNIGFQIISYLAAKQKVDFSIERLASYAFFPYKGKKIHLIKPNTYMNNSGKAVKYWLDKLKVPIDQSLTIVDDIALPFAKVRIRLKGSHGGHNGLKSIESYLQTQVYPRLRFGVGNDFKPGQQAQYVLSPFSAEERSSLPIHLDKTSEIIFDFLTNKPPLPANLP